MEKYTINFDATIGNSISPAITNLLVKLFGADTIKFFDEEAFINGEHRKPCISSCLMVSRGGSYDYTQGTYDIYVHNGTLQSICVTGTMQTIPLRQYLNSYKTQVKSM